MSHQPKFVHEPTICTCLECMSLAYDARVAHDAAEGPSVLRAGAPVAPCPARIEHARYGTLECEGLQGHGGDFHATYVGPVGERELFNWPAVEPTKPSLDIAGQPLGLEDDARMFHVRMVHAQLTNERDRLRDMLAALDVACNDYDREGRELAADLGQVWP